MDCEGKRVMVRGLACGVAVVVLGAVGCGSEKPAPFTLRGSLTLKDPVALDPNHVACSGSGGENDIVQGAAVTVYDAGGKVVGSGSLGSGRYASEDSTAPCLFPFSVPNVPGGSKFYQVEVSHRGKVTFSADEVKAGKVGMSLGS